MKTRLTSAMLAVMMAFGLLAISAPRPAQASEKTWRYLTYGAGALTAYGIIKKKPVLGLAGAAGTYLASRKWKSEVRKRRQREGYRRNVRYTSRYRR